MDRENMQGLGGMPASWHRLRPSVGHMIECVTKSFVKEKFNHDSSSVGTQHIAHGRRCVVNVDSILPHRHVSTQENP